LSGAEHDEPGDLPALLTQGEVVALLRLDQLGLQDPKETLRHLRRTGQLGYVKVAGKVLIPRSAVDNYLRRNSVDPADGIPD
jgi:excisionase family DNA binding protein